MGFGCGSRCRYSCFGSCGCFGLHHGCRCIGQDAFDDRSLFVGGFLRATGHCGGVFHHFNHFVARFDAVQARIVVLEAF